MMKTYPLNDLTPGLVTLVAEARHGEEIVLTDHDRPVAKIVAYPGESRNHMLKAGCLPGFKMSPDFDEPLEDFKDYMR